MAIEQNVVMTRGTDVVIRASMAPPRDITGFTLTFQVKDDIGGTSRITKTTASGITVISAGKGVVDIAIARADTSSLEARRYVWDIRRTDSGSNTEVARGELRLEQGVTE